MIAVFRYLIVADEHVHDPYGGCGLSLRNLCDELGAVFTAVDCQRYRDADSRVALGDSGKPDTYPPRPFTVVCSPIYLNGISSDYKEGPTPNTNLEGRRAYGISVGGPLDPNNLARLVVRSRAEQPEFWAKFAAHVALWDERVLLNVDLPMLDDAVVALTSAGYRVHDVIEAETRRYRRGANADKRAEHEVVVVATKGEHVLARPDVPEGRLF